MPNVSRLPKTAFKPGCAPGPGRPLGQRNKLSEGFLGALASDFAEHGQAAITKVRNEKTHVYLSIIASLCPRELHVERSSPLGELTDEELAQLERYLTASRANAVQQIDGEAVDAKQQQKP